MNNLPANLGAALRAIRTNRGLSLDETALLTGVSKAMLGQIERGESNPTVSSMWKIAAGLKVTFSALMGDVSSTYSVTTLADLQPVYEADGQFALYNVFPFNPLSGFEYFYIRVAPGCRYESPSHDSVQEEFIVVTQGCLELTVGTQVLTIRQGDSIRFKGSEKHTYANPYSEELIFQNIMRY